jgi:hypothetical protein
MEVALLRSLGMADASPPSNSQEEPLDYRFSDAHRDLFRSLAQSMSFVGVSMLLLSVLGGLLFAFVSFSEGFVLSGIGAILVAIASAMMAWWTMSAGRSLGALVRTQGRDVHRLMEGVAQLRLLFGFARVVVILYTLLAVLVAAGIFWCLLVGQAGGKCLGVFG